MIVFVFWLVCGSRSGLRLSSVIGLVWCVCVCKLNFVFFVCVCTPWIVPPYQDGLARQVNVLPPKTKAKPLPMTSFSIPTNHSIGY